MILTTKKYAGHKQARLALPLVSLGAAVAALSGCGGPSTNVGGAGAPTQDSGPVVYGLQAAAVATGATDQGETSGLTFNVTTTSGTTSTTTATGALVAGTKYTTLTGAGPLPIYSTTFSTGIPLGFAPGGTYFNVSSPVAAVPTNYTGSLVFGAYVSTGIQKSLSVNLNTSSIVLTSPEAPGFSVPLAFDPTFGSGVLSQAEYKTAPFALPAFMQTTGLHSLHTTIADVGNPVQSSATDFVVLALAPTDSAALAQVNFKNSAGNTLPVAGAVATITNALPTVAAYKDPSAPTGSSALPLTTSYADAQGEVLLFAQPGAQTITVTGVNPFDGKTVVTGTINLTLVAGSASTTGVINTAASTTPAAAAAIARVQMIAHRKQ